MPQSINDTLIVKPIEATNFTFSQYYSFIQDAYKERVEQGIPFVCTSLSEDELRNDLETNGCTTYIGYESEKNANEIAATISVAYRNDMDGKYAWFHLVATNNRIKGKGYGTVVLMRLMSLAAEDGCNHIMLSTAQAATSAVNFYLKNGFFIRSKYRPFWGGVFVLCFSLSDNSSFKVG